MLVLFQRIGGSQHEGSAEQIPLQFQPGVGRIVEQLAHHGIDRRDQHRDQDQPHHGFADEFGHAVDPPR
jgi:hypothetical protein